MKNAVKNFRSLFLSSKFGMVISVVIGMLFCYLLQNSSEVVRLFNPSLATFITVKSENGVSKVADISGLPAGEYYLSAGKPRSLCDLKIDGQIVDSTISAVNGYRSKFLLGTAFLNELGKEKKSAEIFCTNDGGFNPGIPDQVTVLPFKAGVLHHFLRAIMSLILGPTVSFILLLSVLFSWKMGGGTHKKYFLLFSIFSLLYSLSLAHIPRIFFTGFESSIIHWTVLIFFRFSFYKLCESYSKNTRRIEYLYGMLFITMALSSTVFKEHFDDIYAYEYPFFMMVTFLSVYDLSRAYHEKMNGYFVLYLSTVWAAVQFIEVINIFKNTGVFMAPAVATVFSIMVAILNRRESLRAEKINSSKDSIISITTSSHGIEERIGLVAAEIQRLVHFKRYSVYADAYTLGLHDVPSERLIRIAEDGYEKDTTKDRSISLKDGNGSYMKKALNTQKTQMQNSVHNNAWFLNIPIGKHIVLNYSDAVEQPAYLAYESQELINRVAPVLAPLDEQLQNYAAKMSYELESLRLIRGDGSWKEDIGAVFVDVNYFSDNVKKFGDTYGKFVSTIFIPALAQRVRKWAVREGPTEGDAILLVCIKDLFQEEASAPEAVYKTIAEVMKFCEAEGAEICRAQGYDPIKIQVGANFGVANIICDKFQVRVSGGVVNEAKRVQQAGRVGSFSVHAQLSECYLPPADLYFGELKEGLVKSTRFKFRQVFLKVQKKTHLKVAN